jgi:hypothetical protein
MDFQCLKFFCVPAFWFNLTLLIVCHDCIKNTMQLASIAAPTIVAHKSDDQALSMIDLAGTHHRRPLLAIAITRFRLVGRPHTDGSITDRRLEHVALSASSIARG